MTIYNFILYFVLPAFTLFLIFTSRYYYTKKQSQKMRFHMNEGLFFGNIIAPIVGLIAVLGIYTTIVNIKFLSDIRWELLTIFAISILALIIGIGIGGHIAAVTIEEKIPRLLRVGELGRVLYFFHWPFGHKVPYVPTVLILYALILLDLFRGHNILIKENQFILLTISSFAISIATTLNFIITRVTRVMYYAFIILSLTIFAVLNLEVITLAEHAIAFFFTSIFIYNIIFIALYRYVPYASKLVDIKIKENVINLEKPPEGEDDE